MSTRVRSAVAAVTRRTAPRRPPFVRSARRHRLGVVVTLVTSVLGVVAAPGSSPSARADEPVRQFTLAFTGETIPLPSVYQRAWRNGGRVTYDFTPMYADVAPWLSSADLAVCHLEIPVTPPGMKPSGFPRYASPPEIAVAMKGAGYDRCSLASNHTFDRGFAGVDATLNAMDAAGLGHSGTARTPQEAVAEVFEVNGVRMAHLSYTYGFGLYRLRPPDTWRANRIDPATIIADATDARTRGAEFVFVSLHWGSTGWSRPNDSQKKIAAQLTASGVVDLIVGHHAHVRQTIEFVNGRWVAYGLGNFVSNHRPETGWPAASEDGAIAFFTVTEQPGGGFVVGRPVVRPTWSQPRTFVTWDVLSHLGDPTFARSDLARMSRSLTRSERLLGDFFPT